MHVDQFYPVAYHSVDVTTQNNVDGDIPEEHGSASGISARMYERTRIQTLTGKL